MRPAAKLKRLLKPFVPYPGSDGTEFAIHPITLNFRNHALERRFNAHYFSNNLQVGRFCHLIAIVLYASIGLWDGLIIDPTRLMAWLIAITLVSLMFLAGLLLSYRALELYARYWQLFYALYVIATGAGVTFVATTTRQTIPLYNFVGIIFCLFFCYTIIRLSFIWAALAGNLIIIMYASSIALFSEMSASMVSSNVVYMLGVSILGMVVNYTYELMSRRDFVLNELLKRAETATKHINNTLEQRVADRTEELRKANSELQQSLNALQQAESIAGLGYFEQNWQIGTGYWSTGLHRLLGDDKPSADPVTFAAFLHHVHPNDRDRLAASLQESLQQGVNLDIECRIIAQNGTVTDLHGCLNNMRDKHHQPLVTRGIFQDITEQKATRDALLKTETQLIQAQKMESIGTLAGGIAHDFNNITSIIIGFSELASETLDQHDPLNLTFQEILKAATRSTAITRQLLAFARQQTVNPTVMDLNETMDGMLKMLTRLIGEHIDLTWLPGRQLWPVKVDASQVDQILVNLCVNARDAITGNGKIIIETSNCVIDETYRGRHLSADPGEYVMLSVSDNGTGIAPEDQEKIFEPFFTTKGLGKGTGLGLATVYGIMKQNHGIINIHSKPGKGTTIKTYFPRHRSIPQTIPRPTGMEELLRGNGETLLIVEDDEAIRDLIRIMLSKQGYSVLVGQNPQDAIQLAQTHTIDMLITDVVMPEMNGRELADHLLRQKNDMKVLFMSGYTANIIAHHEVVDKGVNYITKPFTRKDLTAKVRHILDL